MVRENTQRRHQGEARPQKRSRVPFVRTPATVRAHDTVLRVHDAAMAQSVLGRMATTPTYQRWLKSWNALPEQDRMRIAHYCVTADLQVAEHALGI